MTAIPGSHCVLKALYVRVFQDVLAPIIGLLTLLLENGHIRSLALTGRTQRARPRCSSSAVIASAGCKSGKASSDAHSCSLLMADSSLAIVALSALSVGKCKALAARQALASHNHSKTGNPQLRGNAQLRKSMIVCSLCASVERSYALSKSEKCLKSPTTSNLALQIRAPIGLFLQVLAQMCFSTRKYLRKP